MSELYSDDLHTTVVLHTDGGSRGNPGIAGSGSVINAVDAHGEIGQELAFHAEYIEHATNNVAEYIGLVRGLELAQRVGASEVSVFADSKLVIEQMSGRWKVKHEDMKPLYAQAQKLTMEFEHVTYTWVPRAENKRADELANLAMDTRETQTVFVAQEHESSEQDKANLDTRVADKPETILKSTSDPTVHTDSASVLTGNISPYVNLFMLRHGETDMNVARQFSGRSDAELTTNGKKQAGNAAQMILSQGGIDVIYASPLSRAQDTAQIVSEAAGGVPIHTDPRIIEINFGTWEGLKIEDVRKIAPEDTTKWCETESFTLPEGESMGDVRVRVADFLEEIRLKHKGQTVVMVSHMAAIKTGLKKLLCVGDEFYTTMFLGRASLSQARLYGEQSTPKNNQVLSINQNNNL